MKYRIFIDLFIDTYLLFVSMKSELKKISIPNKYVKVNSQIKLTNPQMLIVLCLNIYMANYLRIDICYLLAQSTEQKIILLIVSQIEWRPSLIK